VPELPEVETVVRLLAPRVLGRTISRVDVRWERTLGGMGVHDFGRAVIGAKLIAVHRRAKYLVFDLERGGKPDGHLVGHLRMSGRMHVESPDWDPGVHVRLSMSLSDGRVFHFIDVRKFGRLTFEPNLNNVFARVGDEPLAADFTHERLHALLGARRRQLKPLLLDQSVVAGLGNIYVDESLHRAGLHPLARSDRVSRERASRLRAEIRATLAEAIAREGSSFDAFYRTPEGNPGSYQDEFKVYGREGEPCPRCGKPIARIVVAQRGTHLCRRCQKR